MQIKTHTIDETPHKIAFTDAEPWVLDLVASLQESIGQGPTQLTGDVNVSRTGESGFLVTGNFSWKPQLACGRCAVPLPQNLSQNFDAFYVPAPPKTPKLLDLEASDLDEYYLDDHGEFSLAELLRERLLLSLPSIPSPPLDARDNCTKCQKNFPPDGRVYGEGEEEEDNPFAALRSIKLKN